MTTFLNGKRLAETIKQQLKRQVGCRKHKPGLAVILIGKNPASEIYVKLKEKAADEIDINFKKFIFSPKISQKKIIKLIEKLNQDQKIHGIIVQLPLPKPLNPNQIIRKIDPQKDVDGFVPGSKFISPTHQAILALLKSAKINLKNKRAIILAKSLVFAEPLKKLLEKNKIKINLINKENVPALKKFDVIITSLGRPHFLKSSMIKKGAIIIDVGYSRIGGRPAGDVDPTCGQKASFLSPVPGGVGPLTVIFLLKNVILSAQ